MRSPFALVYAATLVHINIADDCPCPGWCTGKHGQPPALPVRQIYTCETAKIGSYIRDRRCVLRLAYLGVAFVMSFKEIIYRRSMALKLICQPTWVDSLFKAGNGPVPGVITVSQTPGAANCTTIQGAVLLTRNGYRDRYTIQVAPGYYKEKVTIGSNRPPITMIGISDQEDGVLVQWEDCDGCA